MTLLGFTELVAELKSVLPDHAGSPSVGFQGLGPPQPGTPHQHGSQVRPVTVTLRIPSGDAGMKTRGISLWSGPGGGHLGKCHSPSGAWGWGAWLSVRSAPRKTSS